MKIKLDVTRRFHRAYKKLDLQSQKIIKAALQTMAENFTHPSLRVRKLSGSPNIWEASASMDLRITFSIGKPDTIILRNCGHHDSTLGNP